jgi:hypothetical protein
MNSNMPMLRQNSRRQLIAHLVSDRQSSNELLVVFTCYLSFTTRGSANKLKNFAKPNATSKKCIQTFCKRSHNQGRSPLGARETETNLLRLLENDSAVKDSFITNSAASNDAGTGVTAPTTLLESTSMKLMRGESV